jgi:hypothetical protein
MTDSSMGRTGAAGSDGGKLVRTLALAVGAVFLLVGVLGFVPLNTADDWLHFVLGLGMIGMGLLGRQAAARTTSGTGTAR